MKKPVVWVVNTGGTITSKFDPALGGFSSSAGADELIGPFPRIQEAAEIRIREFCNVNSVLLTVEQVFALRGVLEELLAEDGVAGAVVAHGTGTMEESCYLIDLTLRSRKPVVFTGAVLQRAQPDSDGPRNLYHAVRAAAHPGMVGMGVTVVMAGEILAARDAVKVSLQSAESLRAFRVGHLGTVDDEGVHLKRRPHFRRTFDVDRICPRVQLVKLGMGMDDLLVRACTDAYVEDRIDGLVIEALSAGNANAPNYHAIKDACAAGLPVVIASRVLDGTVQDDYGYQGAFRTLREAGAIGAVRMGGTKARMLLMVALAHTKEREELREIFANS